MQRHLLRRAALTGPQMPAVNLDQFSTGNLPQPEVKRQRPLGQIPVEMARRLERAFLHDIGFVDAPLQQPVQPQPHHLPQPRTEPNEQLVARRRLAGLGTPEQIGNVIIGLVHESTAHIHSNAQRRTVSAPKIPAFHPDFTRKLPGRAITDFVKLTVPVPPIVGFRSAKARTFAERKATIINLTITCNQHFGRRVARFYQISPEFVRGKRMPLRISPLRHESWRDISE